MKILQKNHQNRSQIPTIWKNDANYKKNIDFWEIKYFFPKKYGNLIYFEYRPTLWEINSELLDFHR